MKNYILSLDEGTTGTRAIIFDRKGKTVAKAHKEFTQRYPAAGWVEHDAKEIYASQYAIMTEAVISSGISPSEIAAIGITNQRETTVVWNKKTGIPVYNAIVWQCRRTLDFCEKLKADGYEDFIREKTGLPIDAYFSASKIRWILDNVEGAEEAAEQGELLFGTMDTWLIWKLTEGKVHATDLTNASRTMLFNIHTQEWDEELLALFRIPRSMLPDVKMSADDYGTVSLLGAEIPICGVAGDQQAALFGQACFHEGDAKNTYGTGCFLLMNTGTVPKKNDSGLIVTLAAAEKGKKPEYALEGSVFIGGAVVQWIRDELGLIRESSDSAYFAEKVPDNGGVYIVPAFAGLGAPYWNMRARGTITGLTRGSGRNHIIRAALESIAYQTNDILSAMQKAIDSPLGVLKVDGGASKNPFLMQFQADISNIPVERFEETEATALGAAFLAGLQTGFWKNREELSSLFSDSCVFAPSMQEESRKKNLEGWKKAVQAAIHLSELET
ncbi:MAG: glycerol kinase GlpK [Ruminococcaceae bacterium]|nr:glycerol kinase GlpK [Oscillospiraceae bacterium]